MTEQQETVTPRVDMDALQKLAEATTAPWAQLPGETDSAYRYFLIYRNIGPGRTVRAAHRSIAEDLGRYEETGINPGIHVNTLYVMSSKNNWVDRAHAWDVAILNRQGIETAVNFISVLNRASTIALQSLAENSSGIPSIRPRNWKELMEFIGVFAQLVPQETIDSVQAYAREHRVIELGEQGNQQR